MTSFDRHAPARHAVSAPQRTQLTIDVFFDLICPWCWIGTRHLASALRSFAALRPDMCPKVQWRSTQLLPDTPVESEPYQAFYLNRLGSPAAVSARRAQVQQAGHAAGIEFDFARISILPNTQRAHRLIGRFLQRNADAQPAPLVERLFRAYFQEGEDIGDDDVLRRLAAECSPTQGATQAACSAVAPTQAPLGVEVPGVPYYVFNSKITVSGAHPPSALLHAMQRAVSPQQWAHHVA
ncbi:DsbA family oxidoreductase [Ralstonia sp. ASV6]|uniref:DsbA family oxidoreductase n=1 Tax=Ralstonia sp. ASV6 TaxID=2795124 RepID=UPI0018EBB54A|nr:DsbA family oxidoreductase [Ralstonia sp. ASV6]